LVHVPSYLEARLFFGLLEKVAVFIKNSYKRTSKFIENLEELIEGSDYKKLELLDGGPKTKSLKLYLM